MADSVQDVVLRLLRMARDRDLDSAVLMQAIAEVTAITAVTLDTQGDEALAQSLDDRLATFNEHVRAKYIQLRMMAVSKRAS